MASSSASSEQDGGVAPGVMAFSSSPTAPDPKASEANAEVSQASGTADVAELLAQLQDDRQWLLRQLDAGAWPEYRLDLAALERELGALLDRAQEQLKSDPGGRT
ncbi:MAG: hypothetical protein VKL97_04390 [Cyanobacteriota bacterium]|nr:hypothetical protein [Cyanobacteriota bacterium]